MCGVLFHGLKFFGSQLSGLLQNGVRDFDFSYVMQRRGFTEIFDIGGRKFLREETAGKQLNGDHPDIGLRIFYMLSRAAVAAFNQVGHADNDGFLDSPEPQGILRNFLRLDAHHIFQIVTVLVKLNGFADTA